MGSWTEVLGHWDIAKLKKEGLGIEVGTLGIWGWKIGRLRRWNTGRLRAREIGILRSWNIGRIGNLLAGRGYWDIGTLASWY